MIRGFANEDAARRTVRRLKLRRALIDAEALISASLHRLHQRGEAMGDAIPAAIQRRIELIDRQREGGVSRKPIDLVEGQDVREQQLLEGVDLIGQLLDALFEGLGHGLFSPVAGRPERNAGCSCNHRLTSEHK